MPRTRWERYTALDLGWSLDTIRATPGAGYANPGAGLPYEVALQVDPIPATTTQVIVQGGFNDMAYQPGDVGGAASRTLALIHEQAPLATVTVVGPFDPSPGTFVGRYPNMQANAAAIQQATEAAGDRFVDGFSFQYKVGPDRAHPSPTGHADLGHAIADAIRLEQPSAAGDWTGTLNSRAAAVIGVSRVGAFGSRYFYVASTEGGRLGQITEIAFGEAGDVPTLLPDGNGRCLPAVYRPSTGTLYAASDLVDGGGQLEATPVGGTGYQLVQNGSSATPGGVRWSCAVPGRRRSSSACRDRRLSAL